MATGQPSRQSYKCPVKNCKSEYRGDDIAKHFRTNANLLVLDKTSENQSELRKSKTASEVIELSTEYLQNLLVKSSDSEKEHTIYLFQHDYVSTKLPNYHSVNFKCHQKSVKQPEIIHSIWFYKQHCKYPTSLFLNFFQKKH